MKVINKKCPRIRLDAPQSMKSLPMSSVSHTTTYKLSYCYCSQRGYYPNDASKANQDSYCIVENVANDPNTHLFGIYDGHGEFGDYCSFYAADQHIEHLEKTLKKSKGVFVLDDEKTMSTAYTESFVNVNNAMHRSDIDDQMSGTTGITVLVRGDQLFVANVGDSRAIIATEVDGKLKYAPLSQDQTPFRKDERERVKTCGAVGINRHRTVCTTTNPYPLSTHFSPKQFARWTSAMATSPSMRTGAPRRATRSTRSATLPAYGTRSWYDYI